MTPTTNKLVRLEDVQKILDSSKCCLISSETWNKIDNLPTYMEYEIGKEYEFSDNREKWYTGTFHGYCAHSDGKWNHIRPIQVPDEVSSAITLLEQEGYIVTKK